MKNSRTSTKKNNIKSKNNIRKNSTSPSSTKPKNIQKSKTSTTTNKKIVTQTKKMPNKNVQMKNTQNRNVQQRKVQTIRKSDDDIIQFNPDNERKYMEALRQDENKNVKKDNTKDKRESKKNSIKPTTVLKITFFIAFLVVMVYLIFTFETFNLENITVEGNEKYTDEEIINASGLKIGENVLKQLINHNNIDLSYVSSQEYHYSFPDAITIEVKERYPLYIAKDKNTQKYYKLDNEGYLLEECSLDSKNEEILVEGFAFEEEVNLGEKINDVYLHKISIYNDIKKLLESNEIQGTITKVNFANSLTIITLNDKLNIVFANDSNLEYKVTFLKGIIEQNGGMVEGTIDMSIDNPVYSKYD
ncbi:MAG: FtsQ-type POTRA domain-containing protein [Clostridia bacterium]|nr:FtsQ-type POTRA domain-containing protein [Clostridia bacterium]